MLLGCVCGGLFEFILVSATSIVVYCITYLKNKKAIKLMNKHKHCKCECHAGD